MTLEDKMTLEELAFLGAKGVALIGYLVAAFAIMKVYSVTVLGALVITLMFLLITPLVVQVMVMKWH